MNEHMRRQEEARRASKQFLTALSAGQVHPLDRFGNPIEVGQKLLYRTPYDLVFTVQAVTPVLNPQAPPGLLDVVLTVTFPLRVPANQPNPNAVIVSDRTPTTADVPPSDPPSESRDLPIDPPRDLPIPPDGKPSIVLVDK